MKNAIMVMIFAIMLTMSAVSVSADEVITVGDDGDHNSIQEAIDAAKDPRVYEEQKWGDGLQELEGYLEVAVSYEEENIVFEAWSPEDYDNETEMLTFLLDTNDNGTADYQIQWNFEDEDGSWKFKEVNDEGWATAWTDLPDKFDAEKDDKYYSLTVPKSNFSEEKFKFGVDSNGQEGDDGQTFYSADPENLWWNGENYHSSDNYVEMKVGETIPGTIIVEEGEYEESLTVDENDISIVGQGEVLIKNNEI
ncbi:MAG: hypothetical protein ACLFNK_03430, partial [Candidatus Woesearchaeota archaeon]